MKKKLLFSLLLGTAFIWTNNLCAAEVAPAAEEAKPAGDKAAVDEPKTEEVKKYKAIGLDGKEIEVQFFDKSKHPGMVTKFLNLQDGGTYNPSSGLEVSIYKE